MIGTIVLFIIIVALLVVVFKLKIKNPYKISILIFTIISMSFIVVNNVEKYQSITSKENIEKHTLDINDDNFRLYPGFTFEVELNKEGDKNYFVYGCLDNQRYLIKFNNDLSSYDSYFAGYYDYAGQLKSMTKDELINEVKKEEFNNELNEVLDNKLKDENVKTIYDSGNYIKLKTYYFIKTNE